MQGRLGAGPVPVEVPTATTVRSAVVSARTPASVEQACDRLAAALPDQLTGGRERRATVPASPRTAAWGDPPVVLRCGAQQLAGLATTDTFQVNDVAWAGRPQPDGSVVLDVVDRVVTVEVRVPAGVPVDGVATRLSRPIAASLPAAPVTLG